jgi:hypothetical protein
MHVGVVQHAFLLGQDERALCGFKTPKYSTTADRTPRARLALAGPDNPRCPKCSEALALSPTPIDEEAQRLDERLPPARMLDEPDLVAPRDGHSPDPAPPAVPADVVGDPSPEAGSGPTSAAKRRTSVRQGARVTVPAGRRSAAVQIPVVARGSAIAAEIDGDAGDLQVEGVTVTRDGFAQVTLDRRATTAVDVQLYFVTRRSD